MARGWAGECLTRMHTSPGVSLPPWILVLRKEVVFLCLFYQRH